MSEKILVLDDEKEIAEVIALYLRNEGYEVEVAHTGLEALKKVEEKKRSGFSCRHSFPREWWALAPSVP